MAEEKKKQAAPEGSAPDESAVAAVNAPWEGYDEDTAQDVIKRLQDVAPDTARQVREYEAAHQNRKTVVEAAADPVATYDDAEYSRQQLIENAPGLLGAEPFVVDVALRRFATGDFFTVEAAKQAVEKFNSHKVQEA